MSKTAQNILSQLLASTLLICGIGYAAAPVAQRTLNNALIGKDAPTLGHVEKTARFLIRCNGQSYIGTEPEGFVVGGGNVIAFGDRAEEVYIEQMGNPVGEIGAANGAVIFIDKEGKKTFVNGPDLSITEMTPPQDVYSDSYVKFDDGTALDIPNVTGFFHAASTTQATAETREGTPPGAAFGGRAPLYKSLAGYTSSGLRVLCGKVMNFAKSNLVIWTPKDSFDIAHRPALPGLSENKGARTSAHTPS